MQGLFLGLLCHLCLLSVAEATTPAGVPISEASRLTVRYEQGLLTVEAKEVEVERIFQEVARQSGVTLTLVNSSPTPVTLSFARQPLEVGLRSILRALRRLGRVSYLMFYDGTANVTQLQVYLYAQAAGSSSSIPSPPEDLSQYKDVPLTPMEEAKPPPGFDRMTPMEEAKPVPGFDKITPMEKAKPLSGTSALTPMSATPLLKEGDAVPMEKAKPSPKKGLLSPSPKHALPSAPEFRISPE